MAGEPGQTPAEAHSARERTAGVLFLIKTTRLNGLYPERYLRHVLTRIADHPLNRIAEALP